MKSLSTYLKDNKPSLISLNERLIINNNFNGINANDAFYNKFSSILSADSDINYFKIHDIRGIIPQKVSIEDKNAVNKIKEFFNDNSIKYSIFVTDYFKKEYELYYNILKFVDDNKDDMKLFYMNDKTKNGDYLIYLFEAGDIKVCVWGYKDTNRGTIAFQYI